MMDTFFEQIVAIRKTGKAMLSVIGIWLAAFLVIVILVLYLIQYLGGLVFLASLGVLYGAYKLSGNFSVEYEYIITNGTMDIDKIVAKSSRKRKMSFEIANIERIEKYNPAVKPVGNFSETLIACNEDDENAYFAVVVTEGKGSRLVVFAPDERIRNAVVKFLPKYIANSAFKN